MSERNAQGSRKQWIRKCYRAHRQRLVRYAASLLGDAEAAGEVVQETFVELCRVEREEVEARLVQWLFTVCRNRALDVLRKERTVLEKRPEAPTAPRSFGPPGELLEAAEEADAVLRLLSELPESQQEVVRLKFQGGLSYAEISEVTDHSVSNVGFLIHTGIKAMRRRLEEVDADEARGGAR